MKGSETHRTSPRRQFERTYLRAGQEEVSSKTKFVLAFNSPLPQICVGHCVGECIKDLVGECVEEEAGTQ